MKRLLLTLAMLTGMASPSVAQTAAGIAISQLPSGGTMQSTDIVPVVRNGSTIKVTPSAVSAAIPNNTILGNNSGSAGSATALTQAQASALLNVFTSTANGTAPASGGGTSNFLRADATWASPTGGGGASTLAAANSWSALNVVGDVASRNDQFNPLTDGYAALLGKNVGLAPNYSATVNSFSVYDCDVVNQGIVPNINPNFQGNPVVTWLPSPNDPSYGSGTYQAHEADTNVCRLGGLSWMGIPKSNKIYAQSTAFANTGTWTNSSIYGGAYGITSYTQGDNSVGTFTGTGSSVYLWYVMNGSNAGTFTWQLDSGTVSGPVAVQGNNAFTFPISNSKFTLGAIRIPVTDTLSHTLKVSVTSSTNASNPVTIIGLGTPPGVAMAGTNPTVYLAGQIYNTNLYPTAVTAFNTDEKTQANLLLADGLSVFFVPVQSYFNFATDINASGNILASGQTHVAQAFAAYMQASWNAGNYVNPLNYGASCNSIYFANGFTDNSYAASSTQGSNVIAISNYIFKPGIATQTGGGDVGKRICLGAGSGYSPFTGSATANDIGPCSYIASVDTASNTATIGYNAAATNAGTMYAIMGGYPTNPNDPSTATDDSPYIVAAANAALLSGSKVFAPTNCMVHALTLPQNVTVEGNSPGDFYLQTTEDITKVQQATIWNMGITGYPDDTAMGIQTVPHTRIKNIMLRAPTFPYTPYGISGACLGYSTNSNSGPGGQILTENLSFFGCPVDIGQAYGYNHPVAFTASIAGNQMTVSAITSTNFNTADGWGSQTNATDFLAIGRTVTGSGVPSNTTILAAAPSGKTGIYTLSTTSTVSSESMTSAANGSGMEIRDRFSQHNVAGIGYNGDFSDSIIEGSTCTGTFMNGCLRMGPALSSFGNGGNRWIGGRMEEMAFAAVTCDGCDFTGTGIDFDFNGGNNIRTLGANPTVQITGGAMHAGGHLSGFNNAMISIGGTGAAISVDGTFLTNSDFANGGSTTYLFYPVAGATINALSVTGGNTNSFGNVITGMFNWANVTPTCYKQNSVGWAYIDTCNTALSTSMTGQIGIGTASPVTTSKMDVVSTTQGTRPAPSMTTTQKNAITSPAEGLEVYDNILHAFNVYNGSAWQSMASLGSNTFTTVQTFSGTIAQYITGGNIEFNIFANGNSGTSLAMNCDNGAFQSVTITGAVTFIFTTPTHPCRMTVFATQDGTGHAYNYPSTVIWPAGVAPTWSSSANGMDAATFVWDGANTWGEGNSGFTTTR